MTSSTSPARPSQRQWNAASGFCLTEVSILLLVLSALGLAALLWLAVMAVL